LERPPGFCYREGVKSARTIAVADHLWEVLERMAEEMGVERDALVNQAVHVFARLHGYVVPGTVSRAPRPAAPTVAAPAAPAPAAAAPPPAVRAAEPPTAPAGPVPPPPPASALRPERVAAQEQVLAAAARLERDLRGPARLVVVREDGTEVPVAKDRFVVGRGRHCDLVVDSPKVSREHAAIGRDGDAWFVEDLGSSNGTWLRRERITRRRIEDGDEYFVSAEKLRCVLK
jgi:nucleoid-associated protein YgaU